MPHTSNATHLGDFSNMTFVTPSVRAATAGVTAASEPEANPSAAWTAGPTSREAASAAGHWANVSAPAGITTPRRASRPARSTLPRLSLVPSVFAGQPT